jgi:hypothetical protein
MLPGAFISGGVIAVGHEEEPLFVICHRVGLQEECGDELNARWCCFFLPFVAVLLLAAACTLSWSCRAKIVRRRLFCLSYTCLFAASDQLDLASAQKRLDEQL